MATQVELRDQVTDLSDKHEKAFRSFFGAAISMQRSEVDPAVVQAGVEANSVTLIEEGLATDTLRAELGQSGELYINAESEAGKMAATQIPKAAALGRITFNTLDIAVVNWASARSGALVVDIVDQQRKAINYAVTQGLATNVHPRSVATKIIDNIGLTSRQASANDKLREQLVADGATQKQVDKAVERHRRAKLRERSKVIARNEMATAIANGREEMWRQASAQGLLDTDILEQQWITARDERVDCCICKPMDRQRVPVGVPFITGDGRSVMKPGSDVHIMCRCVAILVTKIGE